MLSKLTTRDWVEADMTRLADFHNRMEVGYTLPESFGPLFAIRKAVVDENGDVMAFAAVKITAEAMFWTDPRISSLIRAKSVKILDSECAKEARNLGLEDCSCWIPERISKCFASIIEKLGWRKSPWASWSKELK